MLPSLSPRKPTAIRRRQDDARDDGAVGCPSTGHLRTECRRWRFFPTSHTTDWRPSLIKPSPRPTNDPYDAASDLIHDKARLRYAPNWTAPHQRVGACEDDPALAARCTVGMA